MICRLPPLPCEILPPVGPPHTSEPIATLLPLRLKAALAVAASVNVPSVGKPDVLYGGSSCTPLVGLIGTVNICVPPLNIQLAPACKVPLLIVMGPVKVLGPLMTRVAVLLVPFVLFTPRARPPVPDMMPAKVVGVADGLTTVKMPPVPEPVLMKPEVLLPPDRDLTVWLLLLRLSVAAVPEPAVVANDRAVVAGRALLTFNCTAPPLMLVLPV